VALSNNRTHRIITLCGLYVAQGIPWGFMLISLPAHLAEKFKVNDDDLGELTAIILIPWTFKLIWAPIMDTFTIRSMGRRRTWIIGSELMMAATLLLFILVAGRDLSEQLTPLLWMFFIHNCFASLQDVCTDALAVDILPDSERGWMNGMMWGCKLVGKGLGALVLTRVLNAGGLEACVAVQVGLLLAIMLIPILILERPGEKRMPWSLGEARGELRHESRDIGATIRNWLRGFALRTMVIYAIFALTKIIGGGINEIIIKTLCIQNLNPHWTDEQFSDVVGGWALAPILIGAFGGGYLADRFGRRLILVVGYGGFGLGAMLFAANHGMWDERWFTTTYLLSYEMFAAIGSVGFLSMAMRISWTAAAGTVFTTFMTISNMSHVSGNWLAGPVRRLLKFGSTTQAANIDSYVSCFWLIGLITLLPLLLLFWVRAEEVDVAEENRLQLLANNGPDEPGQGESVGELVR